MNYENARVSVNSIMELILDDASEKFAMGHVLIFAPIEDPTSPDIISSLKKQQQIELLEQAIAKLKETP